MVLVLGRQRARRGGHKVDQQAHERIGVVRGARPALELLLQHVRDDGLHCFTPHLGCDTAEKAQHNALEAGRALQQQAEEALQHTRLADLDLAGPRVADRH